MTYDYNFTVRFAHVDSAGIAFFSRVYEICHEAFESLLSDAGLPLGFVINDQGWGMPVVHSEANYKAPMRLGDSIVVKASIERLGNSSVTFAYDVEDSDGSIRVRARLTHAFIDTQTFRPCAAPTSFREGMKNLGLLPQDQ